MLIFNVPMPPSGITSENGYNQKDRVKEGGGSHGQTKEEEDKTPA